ncbi:hypothetical protein D3C72_1556550 [compost metagenome]
MAEGVCRFGQAEGRCQQFLQVLTEQPQLTTVFATQPQPQVMLGARVINCGSELRERAQAVNAATQRVHQRRTETGYHTAAIDLLQQRIEHARQRGRRLQGEEQMTGLRGNGGGENAWLELHRESDP